MLNRLLLNRTWKCWCEWNKLIHSLYPLSLWLSTSIFLNMSLPSFRIACRRLLSQCLQSPLPSLISRKDRGFFKANSEKISLFINKKYIVPLISAVSPRQFYWGLTAYVFMEKYGVTTATLLIWIMCPPVENGILCFQFYISLCLQRRTEALVPLSDIYLRSPANIKANFSWWQGT